ncbi:Ribonuclease II/R [Penicillium fimorum]|uniref:Ribonuclease II/R n=1 Tax=Penicillium fimorum TaxID=1882269 RepID=A0A9W9XNE7_9EURO|nr:Ribonuclease II/R [Penicillium fimorum]
METETYRMYVDRVRLSPSGVVWGATLFVYDDNIEQETAHPDEPPRVTIDSNIILRSQLELHGDIREYLKKWLDTNPNDLDPVRRSDSKHRPLEVPGKSVGTMPNGRDAIDSWGDPNKLNQDAGDKEEFEGEHLEQGDLIARLNSDGVFNYGIYVRSVHKQKQFYNSNGNWRICSNAELDYIIKGFAPTELVEPLTPWFPDNEAIVSQDIQVTPEGGLPRPLGAPLLRMMGNFKTHILKFYRENSQILDNLHDQVADETEVLCLSLEKLTMTALGIEESELTSVNMFAVHQAVRRHPFLIEKDGSSLFSRMYLVQPKRIANVVKQVVDWTHEHQEHCVRAAMRKDTQASKDHPMNRFIAKAQRLIRLSRRLRSPTIMSSVGPSSNRYSPGQDGNPLVFRELPTEKFSAEDSLIIEYLKLYSVPAIVMPSGTLRSTATHIMRATGMYNTLGLSEASTRLLLQEIGIIAPWENLLPLDQYLMLPGHGISLAKDMELEEIEESCSKLTADQLQDSMQHLRKDWGDMPVYCVDDVTAQEIDDGISLEPIPGSHDTFWVHVHVANPTAFIGHDNPIIQYAASRLFTSYIPERTYPMLPKALTEPHFSLASGRPVLTFSAKMNRRGEILDSKIQNGTIHNVINLTHKTLRDFFDPDPEEQLESLTIGGAFTEPPIPDGKTIQQSLRPEDKDRFHIMRQLMLAFRQTRRKNGAMDLTPLSPDVSVSVQSGNAPMPPYDLEATTGRHYLGDPIIRLNMHTYDPYDVRDQSRDNLVSLIMNLAGHISGQFCATRNIPVIYDGTWYDPEYGRVTNKNLANFGGEGFYELSVPLAYSSTTPTKHHTLGLDTYVKSTSPLRRYTDVIAHYQIEAALRFEHEHGRQFDALVDSPDPAEIDLVETETELAETATEITPNNTNTTPTSLLPFSKSEIDAHLIYSQPLRRRLRNLDKYSTQHWACMLLFRAFYFSECSLPVTFPCLLRTPRIRPRHLDDEYAGVITNLGVNCSVTIPDDFPDKDKLDIFCMVEAHITAVDMSSLQVTMEATEFIKPFERKGEWA